MAAEGAIAKKKKVLYSFSLNFTFFFKDSFRVEQCKNRAETMCFYITQFNLFPNLTKKHHYHR